MNPAFLGKHATAGKPQFLQAVLTAKNVILNVSAQLYSRHVPDTIHWLTLSSKL